MENVTYPTMDPQIAIEDNTKNTFDLSKYNSKLPTKEKLQNLESRLAFFKKCKDNNIIPKGFRRHFWLASNINNYRFVDLILNELN